MNLMVLLKAYIATLAISPEDSWRAHISPDFRGRSKILLVLNNSRVKPPRSTQKTSSVMISQIGNHFSSLN